MTDNRWPYLGSPQSRIFLCFGTRAEIASYLLGDDTEGWQVEDGGLSRSGDLFLGLHRSSGVIIDLWQSLGAQGDYAAMCVSGHVIPQV